MRALTILVIFLHFRCLHPFALRYDLKLVKEKPSVFLGDSVKLSLHHFALFGTDNATKWEYVAPVRSHMHYHFNFATECTARSLKFAPKGLSTCSRVISQGGQSAQTSDYITLHYITMVFCNLHCIQLHCVVMIWLQAHRSLLPCSSKVAVRINMGTESVSSKLFPFCSCAVEIQNQTFIQLKIVFAIILSNERKLFTACLMLTRL